MNPAFLPTHSYEEMREIVVNVLIASPGNGVNQFGNVVEQVGRILATRHRAPPLATGMAYPGAGSRLQEEDSQLIQEIVWDLFRQGVITLGLDSSNAGWPWLRLSRFGVQSLQNRTVNRFHDTSSYMRLLNTQVPDISDEAVTYLEEAIASFYADCLLACCVMLGVAAEAEFIRLVDVAMNSKDFPGKFSSVGKETFIRSKIRKFQDALNPIVKSLTPKKDFEDVESNLNSIQSVIRVSRNDAGHPSVAPIPSREQVYVYLQLFIPYAKQVMHLRRVLA